MKTINLESVDSFKLKDFRNRIPNCSDVKEIISCETQVMFEGKLIALYKKINFDLTKVRNTCFQLRFDPYIRQSGLVNSTLNVNAMPRNGRRDNRCQHSRLSKQRPHLHQVFLKHGRKIAAEYRANFRKAYVGQVKQSFIGSKTN